MKASELISNIQFLIDGHGDLEMICFANDELFPVLSVQEFEGEIEIGCGWDKLREE